MAGSAEATGDVAHMTKSGLLEEVQSLQTRLNELAEECADLERANRALGESEGRLAALVEHMPAVAFVRDLEGRFALVNRGYEETYGVANDHVHGKTLGEVFPQDVAEVYADHDRRVIAEQQVIEQEISVALDGRAQGFSSVKFPIRDSSGEMIAIGGIEQDITERKRADEAHRDSEARLHLALQATGAGVWDYDLKGGASWWSPELYGLLGCGPDELPPTYETWTSLLHPEDRERMTGAEGQDLEDWKAGQALRSEYRLKRKDGSFIWVEDLATATLDRGGQVLRQTGVMRDVTERKEAEEALRQSEERYTLAMDGAGEGLWDWDLATEHVSVSPRFWTLMGFEAGELRSTPEVWLTRLHPDDQRQYQEDVRAHLRGETEFLETEFRVQEEDGDFRWLRARGLGLRDDQGRVYRMAGSLADITSLRQAQQSLHDSEQRLLRILASSPIGAGIALTDPTNPKLMYVNERYAEMFGASMEDLLGGDARDRFADQSRRLEAVQRVDREGSARDLEMRLKRPDGSEFWGLVSFFPIEYEGAPARIAWFYDITERKKAEHRFRALLESAPDAMVIAGQDGKIVLINHQTEALFGYDSDELMGKDVELLMPERLRKGHPEHRKRFFADPKVRPMGFGLELYGQAKGGREFPIEISLSPIHTDDGSFVSAAVRDITERKLVEQELQKRSKLIELLRQTAETANKAVSFEAALGDCLTRICKSIGWPVGHAYLRAPDGAEKMVPSGIWHLSDEDRFKVFKEVTQRTTFESGNGLPGRVLETGRPEWIDDVMQHPNFPRAKAARGLGVHSAFAVPVIEGTEVVAVLEFFTEEVLKTDESTQQTFQTIMQIGDQLGQVRRRVEAEGELRHSKEQAEAALADLTKAQQQLVTTEKMASLGQLTAGIAHEIKNPLNFVNNFSETSVELLDELKEVLEPVQGQFDQDSRDDLDDIVETLRGDLHKINHHGKRADSIVKSMLLHARGDAGARVQTPINTLVDEALNLAYHGERARDKSFQVTMDHQFDEDAGQANLVPQEITRVLVNLFSNAFYAVKKRGREADSGDYAPTVTVWTADKGEDVEVRVRDNGTGMPADVREKLFDPFFTTKPTGEGTGLGMSMSFDIIVQQHGGRIDVDSEPGAFTEFVITLPRGASDGQSSVPEVEVA